MTLMNIPSHPFPDADRLAGLLQDGPSVDAVAQLLPKAEAEQPCVERVHFPATKPIQLQIRVGRGDGEGHILLGEWVGDQVVQIAAAEAARLAKPRRGQLADSPSVVADARHGLLLRRPGFDAKLPGLRLLHDPLWSRERLAALGLDPASTVTLVAHRLGKRAVLRITGAHGTHYARLRAVTSGSGRQAYDRHLALYTALDGAEQLAIPRPLGFDPELGLALFDSLPGTPPAFRGLDGYRAVASVMRAVALLQSLTLPAPTHTAADELALLDGWASRVRHFLPDLSPLIAAPLARLHDQSSTLRSHPPVLCHRDLHEGQILLHAGRTGLLDFDTLRLGDPALDAGNLQAHLILASLRDGRSGAAFVTAIDFHLPHLSPGHIAWWRRAALLRLAMIYAFSAEPRSLILALIAKAA